MLARSHRLIRGEEFRRTSRRGRRRRGEYLAVISLITDPEYPARFGFTMSRKVGNAVTRNRIRRQLRAIAWELVQDGVSGVDVVVRGLPNSDGAQFGQLRSEFSSAVRGAVAPNQEELGR